MTRRRTALAAPQGFGPEALRAAQHLLGLELPTLCVLQQRWAQILPAQRPAAKVAGAGTPGWATRCEVRRWCSRGQSISVAQGQKRKKKGGAEEEEETKKDARGALREGASRVATALGALQEALPSTGPLASTLLQARLHVPVHAHVPLPFLQAHA